MTTVGIDEVGRGCWAGPVVAGAAILPAGFSVPLDAAWRLDDSKKLNRLEREAADLAIRQLALVIGIGWVSSHEVDELGLTAAVGLAMRRALESVTIEYDEIVIDGNYNFLPDLPKTHTLIKADSLVPAVSAASIVAKVARDRFMAEQAVQHPGYGFESHVGYGTKQHLAALQSLGVSELHRRSYRPIQQFL